MTDAASRLRFGCWIASADFTLAETVAGEGLDWIIVDREHGLFSPEALPAVVAACERYRVPALVRIPKLDAHEIGIVLDYGFAGIVVPHVDSADDARSAVALTRFPPHGRRGWGPRRQSDYGRRDPIELAREAAASPPDVWVQIESAASVAAIGEIVAVEGITGIIVGPADLSADFGEIGQVDSPLIWDAITLVADAARPYDIPFCVAWGNPSSDQVARSVKLGARIISIGTQERLLRSGIVQARARLAAAAEGSGGA